MNSQVDVDVIELEDLDDDADGPSWLNRKDATLTMESVPFKEKVEKWLMTCDDSGSRVKKNLKNSEIFEEKIVVSERIEETESLHSVDTEQYIKSNRTKTTTKITTTTIRKYYSLLKVDRNRCNNNDENHLGDRIPLPAIKQLSSNEGEIKSCKVGRRSSRRQNNRLPSPYIGDGSKTNVKPKDVKMKRGHLVVKADRSAANKFFNQNVSASTSRACNPERILKRVTKKRSQRSTGGSRNKLKTSCVDLSVAIPNKSGHKKSTPNNKLKSGLKQIRHDDNIKYTNQVSSDSEEDILLTSYRTYPNIKYFKRVK